MPRTQARHALIPTVAVLTLLAAACGDGEGERKGRIVFAARVDAALAGEG